MPVALNRHSAFLCLFIFTLGTKYINCHWSLGENAILISKKDQTAFFCWMTNWQSHFSGTLILQDQLHFVAPHVPHVQKKTNDSVLVTFKSILGSGYLTKIWKTNYTLKKTHEWKADSTRVALTIKHLPRWFTS